MKLNGYCKSISAVDDQRDEENMIYCRNQTYNPVLSPIGDFNDKFEQLAGSIIDSKTSKWWGIWLYMIDIYGYEAPYIANYKIDFFMKPIGESAAD